MCDKRTPQDLVVRRLRSADQDDICEHFLRLDVQTRRARFCGGASDESVLRYARNLLRYDSIACGAFVSGQLRGIVELRGLFHSWPSRTEAAFSVEAEWQRIGIGDALFEQMLAMARNRGVMTIEMMCLKENSHMRHLAEKHNARLLVDVETVEAVLHPSWPTPFSIAKEIIAETRGYSYLHFG
ncbi:MULTISPECIES: GNAT family N-acetyltransferase [unclassified Ruegeria]|uniref:GNAT family N-acetyltransferase n=1 Tax=unclassified Ruegeria TaxID=2625375 RepID=UPI001487B8A5|nr:MULTISPECIES: GNAT family N-acetyltransferase [unclassified Ruegeria]